jgi:hypothetical protein
MKILLSLLVILVFGVGMFVLQYQLRRSAIEDMGMTVCGQLKTILNLNQIVPKLDTETHKFSCSTITPNWSGTLFEYDY